MTRDDDLSVAAQCEACGRDLQTTGTRYVEASAIARQKQRQHRALAGRDRSARRCSADEVWLTGWVRKIGKATRRASHNVEAKNRQRDLRTGVG